MRLLLSLFLLGALALAGCTPGVGRVRRTDSRGDLPPLTIRQAVFHEPAAGEVEVFLLVVGPGDNATGAGEPLQTQPGEEEVIIRVRLGWRPEPGTKRSLASLNSHVVWYSKSSPSAIQEPWTIGRGIGLIRVAESGETIDVTIESTDMERVAGKLAIPARLWGQVVARPDNVASARLAATLPLVSKGR